MTRLSAVAALALLFALPLSGQNVQYDTGFVTAVPVIQTTFGSTDYPGNTFTGLTGGNSITRVTAHVLPGTGPFWFLRFRQSAAAPGQLAQINVGQPAATGLTTFTLGAPVVFTGNRVWVGADTFYNKGLALDTNSGGFGFHATFSNGGGPITYGGNQFNFILRITGPGLPVELVNFTIE